MGLGLIKALNLQDQIREHLVDLIIEDEYGPGDRLPSERELAQTLGVGRGSLRQAVVALELDGLLEVRTSSGIYVAPEGAAKAYRRPAANGTDMPPLDIIRARRTVEGETAALAAGHAGHAGIEAAVAAHEELLRRDERYDVRHPADRHFHLVIADAAGNKALAEVVVKLWEMQRGRLYMRMEDHFSTAPMREEAVRDHARIVRALRERDPAGARRAMHLHLDRLYADLATSSPSGDADGDDPFEGATG